MRKILFIAAALWGCKRAPTLSVECPPGTSGQRVPTSEAARKLAYFPQYEDFCVKDQGVRHGPFVQLGPNGERLVEGNYVDGKMDGAWIRRLPSQTQHQTWAAGTGGETTLSPREGFDSIDVASCVTHEFGFPVGLGSGRYTVIGKTADTCEVHLGGETEGARHAPGVCRFPVGLGRVHYTLHSSGTFEFGAPGKHCGAAAQNGG